MLEISPESATDEHAPLITEEASSTLPTRFGDMLVKVFKNAKAEECLAIISGQPTAGEPFPVRVHSACLTAEVLSSLKCDCKSQLDYALEYISKNGGMVIYLPQEGRGVGLVNKIRAYALQEDGLDTVDANRALGLPDDARDYQDAASILNILDIDQIQLMTNNPLKVSGLKALGVDVVDRVAVPLMANDHSINYLKTKHARMGHLYNLQTDPLPNDTAVTPLSRPVVHVNFALDCHGGSTPDDSDTPNISCAQDWQRVHELREQYTAIVVGGRTWRRDQPQLTARAERLGREPRRQPKKVIFSGSTASIDQCDQPPDFVVGAEEGPAGTVHIQSYDHNLIEPLKALRSHGVNSLLVEGGLTLLRSFAKEKLIDRLTIYVRTDTIAKAAKAVNRALPELSLDRVQFEKFGRGILISGQGPETLMECDSRQ